ncbi:hypothetical protein GCM10023081_47080 [Arthrobacter ginkgonis]|uniref:HNH endonuclease n=1 Tax=Arthrobacter ginkgonis TaxID=1630594 RepID=A0ABP7DKV3_9MICC
MMIEITRIQAQTLANFIHTIRRDWDPAGITEALGRARHRGTPDQIAHAAIRAAGNPKNRTPGVIPLDGEHWRNPWQPPDPTPKRELHCGEHDCPESVCKAKHYRTEPPEGWRNAQATQGEG